VSTSGRANAAGLAHLCLVPESLWCTADGKVKIGELGTAAALAGVVTADPAQAGTRGLAALLYAALTGCWPGPQQTTLRPARARAGARAVPASCGQRRHPLSTA